MSKLKKILLILLAAIFLIFIGYFFVPKSVTKCGSTADPICLTCKCSMGIPYDPAPIGGQLQPHCFMGKLLECKKTDYTE